MRIAETTAALPLSGEAPPYQKGEGSNVCLYFPGIW